MGGSACRPCCHGAHTTVHGVRCGPGLTRKEISGLHVFFFLCSSWQILSYFCANIIFTASTVLSLVDSKEQILVIPEDLRVITSKAEFVLHQVVMCSEIRGLGYIMSKEGKR